MQYVLMGLFGICMIYDLKNKMIPSIWIWICILVAAGYRGYSLFIGKCSLWECFWSIIPGILLLFFSSVTRQMGKGDGLLIVAAGFFLGGERLMVVLGLAFLLVALFAVAYILIRRDWKNYKIPFVPFLFLAMLIRFKGVCL